MSHGVKELLSYLSESFRVDQDGEGQHILHTSGNDRCDAIEMDYAGGDSYEVSVNGLGFALNQAEFESLISSHRLGVQDECDSLAIKYKGRPVQEYEKYTGHASHFFSLVSREFGMWRLELSSGQKSFYDALDSITNYGDRLVTADSIEGAPKELAFAIRHSVPVGPASGTIAALPGGRLGVITASHVIRAAPLHFPQSTEVTIDGRRYTLEALYDRAGDYWNAWGDDWAILLFSPEDSDELRAADYSGVHITARDEYPERFTPVFGLGFPEALRRNIGHDDQSPLELSKGYLTMRPGDGPERKQTITTEEDGVTFVEHLPDRGVAASSAWACPGYSGGGLFWFNPGTERVELIGVHVYPHASQLDGIRKNSRGDLNMRVSTFHAFVDQERAISLLDR